MSIRPMDFQVMFPKTPEVSKSYTDEANKNQAIHQQQAEANREKIDENMKQVLAREKVEGGRVDDRQPKDRNSQDKKKKKQKQAQNENGSTIDIRI